MVMVTAARDLTNFLKGIMAKKFFFFPLSFELMIGYVRFMNKDWIDGIDPHSSVRNKLQSKPLAWMISYYSHSLKQECIWAEDLAPLATLKSEC